MTVPCRNRFVGGECRKAIAMAEEYLQKGAAGMPTDMGRPTTN